MATYKHLVEANKEMVQRLAKKTNLDEDLVRNIVKFSRCLCKPGYESIDSEMFSTVLARYFNITEQTAVNKYFINRTMKRADGQMAMEDFANILCSFMTDDLDIKIEYVFNIYDVNGDGSIDMVEILTFTKSCKCVSDLDDGDKDETYYDLSNMAAQVLGVGPDGISIETFREKARENQLVLSILGEALPRSGEVAKFRQKIEGKSNLQMINMFGDIRYKLLREMPDRKDPKHYPITLDLP